MKSTLERVKTQCQKIALLTHSGNAKAISGHFLPNLLATIPNIEHDNKNPKDFNAVVHVAWSVVILPVGSGESSEVSNTMLGDDQPTKIPYCIPYKATDFRQKKEN